MKRKICQVLSLAVLLLALLLAMSACKDDNIKDDIHEQTPPVSFDPGKVLDAVDALNRMSQSLVGVDTDLFTGKDHGKLILLDHEDERRLIGMRGEYLTLITTSKGKTSADIFTSKRNLLDYMPEGILDITKLGFVSITIPDLVSSDETGVYSLSRNAAIVFFDNILEVFSVDNESAEDLADKHVVYFDVAKYAQSKEFNVRITKKNGSDVLSISIMLGRLEEGIVEVTSKAAEMRMEGELRLKENRLVGITIRQNSGGNKFFLDVNLETDEAGEVNKVDLELDMNNEIVDLEIALDADRAAAATVGKKACSLLFDVKLADRDRLKFTAELTTANGGESGASYGVKLRMGNLDATEGTLHVVNSDSEILSDAEKSYYARVCELTGEGSKISEKLAAVQVKIENELLEHGDKLRDKYFTVDGETGLAFFTEMKTSLGPISYCALDHESRSYLYIQYYNGITLYGTSKAMEDAKALAEAIEDTVPKGYKYMNAEGHRVYKYMEEYGVYILVDFTGDDEPRFFTDRPVADPNSGLHYHELLDGEPIHNYGHETDEKCYHTLTCKDCGFTLRSKRAEHFDMMHYEGSDAHGGKWSFSICTNCRVRSLTVYDSEGAEVSVELSDVYNYVFNKYKDEELGILCEPSENYGNAFMIRSFNYDAATAGAATNRTLTIPDLREQAGFRIIGIESGPHLESALPAKTTIILPEGMEFISDEAFSGMRNLNGVTLPSTLTFLGNAFENTSITELTIPRSVRWADDITCHSLEKLTVLPEKLPRFAVNADALKDLDLRSAVEGFGGIYSSHFREITVPEGTLKIVSGVGFNGNKSVKRVILPDSVIEIEAEVFMGATNLEEIIIPDTLTSIGNRVFSNCLVLRSVRVRRNGEISDENKVTLPSKLTELGEGAFEGCRLITSVELPEGITEIKSYTFRKCSGLVSVVLPNGLESVGNEIFGECYSIAELVLPESLKNIGEKAFSYCMIKRVVLHAGVESFGKELFLRSIINEIDYDGSIEDWKRIVKGESWADHISKNVIVRCTDGDLTHDEML